MGAKCLRAVEEFDYDTGPKPIPFPGDSPSALAKKAAGLSGARTPAVGPIKRWGEVMREEHLRAQGGHGDHLKEVPGGEPALAGDLEAWLEAWAMMLAKDDEQRTRLMRGPQMPVPVTLHIYNVGEKVGKYLNRLLRPLGTGAFHCGVEVYGCEWAYSDTTSGTGDGVFCSRPKCCAGHNYCESVSMGKSATSEGEVLRLIQMLKHEWPVKDYDTLTRNCCHFSNELCQRLGVGSIPSWVINLANAGAAIRATGDPTCCRQVLREVGDNMCCSPGKGTGQVVEVVDVVDQLPVLKPELDML